ncbi:MAG: hypothetical protein IPK19_26520 [Chloroflexi bacterium]|nr:hypothetical protein [Chloroflexota bacterium]
MIHRKALLGIVIAAALFLFVSVALASVYNGTVAFTCTEATAAGTGSHVLDRDNTGTGQEQLRVDVTDGDGTLIASFTYSNALTTYNGGIGVFNYTTAPDFNPLTFTLTSLAGNGLPEQVDYVQQGSCVGLPTYGAAGAGCGLNVPSGSVVGEAPLGAQAYYAPGEVASGVVLNPGTYIVVGLDESGEYYKVVLACQFVWVRAETMQPSFQAPQNGQALPTGVVS